MAKNRIEQRLTISKIKASRDVQPRVETDKAVVAEYAERVEAGDKLPPVVVFFDDETYWLAEGFHRLAAYRKADRAMIDCIVIDGTKADAQWHALQTNKTHGLRRTNEDKQRAVVMALQHPKGATLSDRQIAELIGVSNTMVGKHRKEVESTVKNGQSEKRIGRDGRTINTAKIGKTPKAKTKSDGKTEAKRTTTAALASDPADQEHTGTGDDHGPAEHDGVREPEVAQQQNEAETAGDDQTVCSIELIDNIENVVTGMEKALGTILWDDEVAAIPSLSVLLRRLEIAIGDVIGWLVRERAIVTDLDETEKPAEDNADEADAEEPAEVEAAQDGQDREETTDEEVGDDGQTESAGDDDADADDDDGVIVIVDAGAEEEDQPVANG